MNQIPRLRRFEVVRKGRHRCSIETSHEYAVQILIRFPTFEARSSGKVVRPDRIVFTIGECGSRRPIAVAGGPMTFPAFHFLEERPATQHALDSRGSFGRNRYRRSM